jgi:predicted O-methyltransferase YrrM
MNLVKRINGKCRIFFEYWAKKRMQKNKGLWLTLEEYLKKTGSTGCSFHDYLVLYNYVKKNKPKEVLECSTGVSTIVMAYAMMENEKDGYGVGRITSMEESFQYYDSARQLLPLQLVKYVDLFCSPKVEAFVGFFRGVKYKDVPIRDYDFVYVDGPTTSAPSDGQKTFDFDFIEVVSRSGKPVSAIIDCRLSTIYVLSRVFGRKKI